jgi:type I restriction enzyme S subunit
MSAANKLVPELRFPEFRGDGEWVGKPLNALSKRIRRKVGTKKLTPVSITAGLGFVDQTKKFGRRIAGEQYKNYIHIRRGDFVYNKGNSKTFAQGCVYQLKEFEEAAASTAFICFKLDEGCVDHYFQSLFECNTHGRKLRKFITSGARSDGLLNINPTDFFSIELPLPPRKAEQQKIADCLGSLGDLIAAHRRKLAALQDHKKGLLQNLFPAEKDSGSEKGELRSEKIPKLRFPGFKGEWEEQSLKKLATYQNGKAYEKHILDEGKYVVVNSRFISTEGKVKKFTNEEFCPTKKGDVLMVLSDLPKGRALAKCFFVEDDNKYGVNQRVVRLRSKDIHDKFLFYRLNRHSRLMAYDDGITQTHLSKSDVEDCLLFIPDADEEQKQIADCLSALDACITAQTEQIAALKEHKKGLMQKLFPITN